MTNQYPLDALGQPIRPGDKVTFLDGHAATVTRCETDKAFFLAGVHEYWAYSFCVLVCKPPAAPAVVAVVASANGLQGASCHV